jgi:hypothetical protein
MVALGDFSMHKEEQVGQTRSTDDGAGNYPPPDVDRLLHLLDCEIQTRDSKLKRGGWTSWALLGALGGTLWLLLSEWQMKPSMNPAVIGRWYLVLYLAAIAGCMIIDFLTWEHSGRETSGRAQLANLLYGGRRRLNAFYALHFPALFALAFYFRSGVRWWAVCWVLLFSAFWCLHPLRLLFLDYKRSPVAMPHSPPRLGTFLVCLFLVGAVAGSAVAYYGAGPPLTTGRIADCRIAGLLALSMLLIRALATISAPDPIVPLFEELRRCLVLGQIDVGEAMRQTESALFGLSHSRAD